MLGIVLLTIVWLAMNVVALFMLILESVSVKSRYSIVALLRVSDVSIVPNDAMFWPVLKAGEVQEDVFKFEFSTEMLATRTSPVRTPTIGIIPTIL